MNLKLVAAMSVLGLVSCPVLADTATSNQAPMPKHHVHHQMAKHHRAPVNYKEAPAPVVCTVSQTELVMDMMTQNAGRSLPNPCNPGWFNRIALSGGINADFKFGSKTVRYMGVNYQRMSLNDAYFNLSANVNDWTKAFVSISYNTATINDPTNLPTIAPYQHVAEYSSAYDNNANGGANHAVQLEQAYFTVGNMDAYPVFLQLGKQFQDFSRYEIHPITRSMTQVMSETLATSAKLGFIAPMGLNGSIWVFDDPISKSTSTTRQANYGVSLGYGQSSCELGWDVGAAYIYNLIGVNDVAYNVLQFQWAQQAYDNRAAGYALYADVNSGPFTLGARWTAAAQRFNRLDLPKNGTADVDPATGAVLTTASGAKPWTLGIQGGYSFDGLWDRSQILYLAYQASHEAAGLQLPKYRWLAGVGIDFWKNTSFVLEWNHDSAYSTSNGGNGNTDNVVTLRAAVKFG